MKEKSKYLIMYKGGGKFYNAFGINAFILHDIFGYKVLDNKKAGFPDTNFDKVTSKLDEVRINYMIIYSDKDPLYQEFNDNSYDSYYNKAMKFMGELEKMNILIEKIKIASEDDINKILEYIDTCLK